MDYDTLVKKVQELKKNQRRKAICDIIMIIGFIFVIGLIVYMLNIQAQINDLFALILQNHEDNFRSIAGIFQQMPCITTETGQWCLETQLTECMGVCYD